MTEVLAGVVGVLIGAVLASAFNFWSVRRAELERATVAGTAIRDELSALLARDPALQSASDREVILSLWREQRGALVLYTRPEDFAIVSTGLLELSHWTGADQQRQAIDRALSVIRLRTDALRKDHQAFILTPLIRYLRTSPWSGKTKA